MESVAKQGALTLAAQIRGVFAGLDAIPAWVAELEARETALNGREAAIPALKKDRDNITAEIEGLTARRREGNLKLADEHEKLRLSLAAQTEPLALALKEAKDRVTKAEAAAVEAEAASKKRVATAVSAAEAAESRLAKAEAALNELGNLTRR